MRKRLVRGAVIGALCGAVLALVGNYVRWASPDDYLNVALVPALAEEVGADLPLPLVLASEGATLLRTLGSMPATASEAANQRGQQRVERAGQRVYDLLSVEQRKVFFTAFRTGEAAPVTYTTEPVAGEGAASFRLSYGWPNRGSAVGRNATAVLGELEKAWQWIPSEEVARELELHHEEAVQEAAERWIAAHEAAQARTRSRAASRSASTARAQTLRDEHEARSREMKARFEESHRAFQEKRDAMRAEHEAMRQENERRFREARARRRS